MSESSRKVDFLTLTIFDALEGALVLDLVPNSMWLKEMSVSTWGLLFIMEVGWHAFKILSHNF